MKLLAEPESPPPVLLPCPPQIGLLATVGVSQAAVIPPPKVGIMSTGDELVEADEPISGGLIRDSNRCHALEETTDAIVLIDCT